MGAGSSYLSGNGYPLATQLWAQIREHVPEPQRAEIDHKIGEGLSLEQALDSLDDGILFHDMHRRSVVDAIAVHFTKLTPPLGRHFTFTKRLAKREEISIPVFSLNYDPLLERAAEASKVYLRDGFHGIEQAYFDPRLFQQTFAVLHRGRLGTRIGRVVPGIIDLFKLHGSLGWYQTPVDGVRRSGFTQELPNGSTRLMVPPQWRKVNETLAVPYEALWSEFRRLLRHGPYMINRLAAIGYGMGDGHVNAVIDAALSRPDFTLLVFAKELSSDAFARWTRPGVIIVTESRSSIYGEVGPGHVDLWSFERLSGEV